MSSITELFTGPDSGAQSAAATKANKQRQASIDYGMEQLNAIYGGGTYNQYAQAGGVYDPAKQYYTLNKGTYSPFTANAHNNGAANRFDQGKLFTSTPSQKFAGYNNDFFNQRARAYEDFALPQLGQQYQTTKNAINFNLANRGLIGGSVANQEHNDLDFTMGQQKQAIADQGQQQAQSLRSDVQNSKLQAISQLYQTANPAQAQSSALADASRFTAPSAFAPLANGFANLVNQYSMNQGIAGYQQQPGGYGGGGGGYMGQYTSPQAQALPENR